MLMKKISSVHSYLIINFYLSQYLSGLVNINYSHFNAKACHTAHSLSIFFLLMICLILFSFILV